MIANICIFDVVLSVFIHPCTEKRRSIRAEFTRQSLCMRFRCVRGKRLLLQQSPSILYARLVPSGNRVWLQTCTCMLRHLHAQTLGLPQVMSLAVFFILFYLLIIFCLNLSTFYNSSQVVKTRKKKLKYNVTCNRCLHFLLPATSVAFDTNRVLCQRRQDTVVVK